MPTRELLITIRRNADGVDRTYTSNSDVEDDLLDFMWGDGCYCCDCNRALFFNRAAGEDDPNRPCGVTEFQARVVDAGSGAVLYDDMDDANEKPADPKAGGVSSQAGGPGSG